MKPSKRMQPVAEMAQQQADTAVKNVAECNRRYTDMQNQLDELLSYRDDYANGLHHKSLKANQIKDYGLFLGRLNQAIAQQQAVLNDIGKSLAASKQVCSEKQQRAKTIDAVVGRYQQVERRAQLRREQVDSDEHALRFVRRQGS